MELDAPIVAVTVYLDRAQVTRRGKATLQAGANELVLSGLPANLEVESLRAQGEGEVAVQILSVESRERPRETEPQEAAREVQRELEATQDAGRAIEQRDETLGKRAEIVTQLADSAAQRYARALAEGQATLEATAQLLDFVQAQTNEVNAQRAAVERERRENAARQTALSQRLAQLGSLRLKSDRLVSVGVEAQSAGDWELELFYTVRGASWKPLYDLRVTTQTSDDALGGRVSLNLNALLVQRTGEDWQNVRVTLSTARPSLGTLPPKLEPAYVDVVRVVTASAMMRQRVSEENDIEEFIDFLKPVEGRPAAGSAPAPAPVASQEARAEVESQGGTVTFGLPRPLSVPSDGQPHRAPIQQEELPARLSFEAIPSRVPMAYLRADVTNASALTLLEGQANVFRDGVYVGGAKLPHTAPNAEVTLFLGPDEQVRAERELTARDVDKNFIGNQRRVHFGYAITLHNLKNQPARVTVRDQMPVSRSEVVKVKLRGCEPPAGISDLNVLTWELTLKPGEKRVLRFDYGVEAPRETSVTGLQE